jgi:hypothetical protein
VACCARIAHADFAGPTSMTRAISPDGNTVVRLKSDGKREANGLRRASASRYVFDEATNTFTHRATFEFSDGLPELIYVSDEGNIVMINLGELAALRAFDTEGKAVGTWDLSDFLTKREIKASAQTGSTLQWFETGRFENDRFLFSGPSSTIKALVPPFTVMRPAKRSVSFTEVLDFKSGEITPYNPLTSPKE